MKKRIIKFMRNTLIGVGVLLLLAVGGGVAYTWYVGQDESDTSAIAAPVEVEPTPVITHVKPAANAKVGAAIQMLTSPVAPGSNASVTVKTNPDAVCTISVIYDKTVSKDSGLSSKTADEFGVVSWAWTVEVSVPLGKWPVKVTCAYNKQSAVVQGDLVVAQPTS